MTMQIDFPDWVKITFTCRHTQKYRYWEIFAGYCLTCDDKREPIDWQHSEKRIPEEDFFTARTRYGCGKAYAKDVAKYPYK